MVRLIAALLLALWLLLVAGVRAEARMEVRDGTMGVGVSDGYYAVVGGVGDGGTPGDGGADNVDTGTLSPEQEARLAIERWFPESEWLTAECVAKRESELNPFARGRAGEVGVFQTHPIHAWAYDWERLESGDIDYQVAVAHNQWEGSGWWPTWTTARICGG